MGDLRHRLWLHLTCHLWFHLTCHLLCSGLFVGFDAGCGINLGQVRLPINDLDRGPPKVLLGRLRNTVCIQRNTELWMNQQMEGFRPGTMHLVSRNQHLVQRRRLVWFAVQFDPQQCGPVDVVDSVRLEVFKAK